MMRPGVLLPPRARTGPVVSPQRGQTLASRSIRARQWGHIRTVLVGALSAEVKTFLSRCHWNHSLGGRAMVRSEVRGAKCEVRAGAAYSIESSSSAFPNNMQALIISDRVRKYRESIRSSRSEERRVGKEWRSR